MRTAITGALVLLLAATSARADEPEPESRPCGIPCLIAKARDKLKHGDAAGARDDLLTAYALVPQPALLFALGQVELELGNNTAAIRYYEQFIASEPGEEQVALAQQAIGAARMRIARPVEKTKPDPPKPRIEHRWRIENTGLVLLGGAALAVAGGLLYTANLQGNDASGTLKEFDDRLDQARTLRLTGVGVAAAGGLAIGLAVVRWRLDRTEVRAGPTPGGATVTVGRRW
jgi:tetratricopeptide (TPR) repeat protein